MDAKAWVALISLLIVIIIVVVCDTPDKWGESMMTVVAIIKNGQWRIS